MDRMQEQIGILKKGAPFAAITAPATPCRGIIIFEDNQKQKFLSLFTEAKKTGRISKFVPASGAATRMFKDMINTFNSADESAGSGCIELSESVKLTLENISHFPFYNDLLEKTKLDGKKIDSLLNNDVKTLIGYILFENGLNYADKPKALLKFSNYSDHSETAFEEHIKEGIELCKSDSGSVVIHFTFTDKYISEAHELTKKITAIYPETCFEIDFSVQKPSTDTIAVYENGEPVRDETGSLVLRPAGHGALIENLNDLKADIVLIKNIDNITHEDHRNISDEYNKLLTGFLISLELEIHDFLSNIDSAGERETDKIVSLMKNVFFIDPVPGSSTLEKKVLLKELLDRPIRVCGMIRNTGEPGGGPFFVRSEGFSPLQIVESSQIDMNDHESRRIFDNSTHFNPVNIVCSLKDHNGKNFDLDRYVDKNAYFISSKTYNGKKIRALELPGLWNGAMAGWLTAFAEVPLEVFCPAKTVNDLLKKERFPCL